MLDQHICNHCLNLFLMYQSFHHIIYGSVPLKYMLEYRGFKSGWSLIEYCSVYSCIPILSFHGCTVRRIPITPTASKSINRATIMTTGIFRDLFKRIANLVSLVMANSFAAKRISDMTTTIPEINVSTLLD